MAYCDECNTRIDGLPFQCRRCGGIFCSKHRLPEDHHCPGLKQGNVFMNLAPRHKRHKKNKRHHAKSHHEPQQHHVQHQQSFMGKCKSAIKRKYYRIKNWLRSRRHRSYRNWNAFFMNLLWVVILSVVFMILYSNVQKLNEIVLWFIPLGGLLLLVCAFFWLKYFWRLLKKIYYWYNGERNWVKYVIIIFILILVWQGYQNQDTLFDGAIEAYDKINFSSILPLGISDDIPEDSVFSKKGVDAIKEDISQNVDEFVNPEPISDKTMAVEKAILKYTNVERKSDGKSTLSWDSNLASVARDHSLDMVENDFFSHDNLRGEDPTARAIRHGYNVHKELGGGWYSDGIAENIGKMPTGNVEGMGYVASDADSIGKAQVESWMQSPGHRQNILDAQYNLLGVGCAYDGLYYVCTQNFK